jgi:hypothetical protein
MFDLRSFSSDEYLARKWKRGYLGRLRGLRRRSCETLPTLKQVALSGRRGDSDLKIFGVNEVVEDVVSLGHYMESSVEPRMMVL